MQVIQKELYDFTRAKNYFTDYITYAISPMQLAEMINNKETDFQIVDLRTLADYEIAHIPGAIHISEEYIKENLDRLDKNKLIILYCYNQFCQLSAKRAIELIEDGYMAIELLGGFKTWSKFRFKTEN